jgi:23S rRNA (pseudouridine1915-N3)-methyltransferase
MQLRIHAIGEKMPNWVQEPVDLFTQRIRNSNQYSLNWVIHPLPKRNKQPNNLALIKQESALLQKHLNPKNICLALDVKGKKMTTEIFAGYIEKTAIHASGIDFVIGGPDGLDPELINNAHLSFSLSDLTLSHPIVRIVLAEQLYRVVSFLEGHPYHRQ